MFVPPKLIIHVQPWETFFGGKIKTITTALADPTVLVPEGVVDLNKDDDAED